MLAGLAAISILISCAPAEPPDFADREVVTVFATAGDPPTVVDLSASISREGVFGLLDG